ncbi:amidohydrolase family protein [Pseudonocardia xinjiangensis]|uniref:Amidohydrolase n=1 Tax=Pseudonocardia xinjiangensis TaxID=75289 RepID=A0ABX1RQB7_9PSEU|nr:amidohydrolase family protein [Pseudonocardia xinjiangensis]NMH82573.1 amidohydrolase [Pseudonocardia xinjiangensis]
MASSEKVRGRVVDAHSHIGTMDAWQFYDLKEPVKPTVYEFPRAKDYLSHLDGLGVERGLVLPNYGIPVQEHAFSLNDLVLDAVTDNERLVGGLWVSFLPQNRDMTLRALEQAGTDGIVALKTTFLLGGNPDPTTWDEETRAVAEACFDAAERHGLVFHFHTSPGGASDIDNFVPLVEAYGKRVKIYLVHFGGGVSGHIKLVPRFLDWVEQGYQVYCDTTWTIGFGARWLMTEIERRGLGEDRVLFASDEPWSDFWSEYWKIYGAPVSDELKQRILCDNYDALYGTRT